ncbi:hypothetical protein DFP72DRAFT_856010 [Ephemerocybe angulata]|uniref:Uncharacterized protein n=1 Tax=Ephemerocybe angulata TaxID=980116 RepID=A0A8H6HF04_9AGAR|nr:hypothetical protein DFP72DRAFT_856010 [Tulosesus angulatus]
MHDNKHSRIELSQRALLVVPRFYKSMHQYAAFRAERKEGEGEGRTFGYTLPREIEHADCGCIEDGREERAIDFLDAQHDVRHDQEVEERRSACQKGKKKDVSTMICKGTRYRAKHKQNGREEVMNEDQEENRTPTNASTIPERRSISGVHPKAQTNGKKKSETPSHCTNHRQRSVHPYSSGWTRSVTDIECTPPIHTSTNSSSREKMKKMVWILHIPNTRASVGRKNDRAKGRTRRWTNEPRLGKARAILEEDDTNQAEERHSKETQVDAQAQAEAHPAIQHSGKLDYRDLYVNNNHTTNNKTSDKAPTVSGHPAYIHPDRKSIPDIATNMQHDPA